jgi:predicted Zn-dependent protease
MSLMIRKIRTGLGAVALASLAGCAVNPVTGQREIALISENQEIQMGRQGAQEAEQSIGLVPDQALQAYVSQLGQSMARTSERPALPWQFGVVDDPTPNAFALPGGFIYITRGLMSLMNSEAELVSVLGHEIGHVTARHSVNMISRAQLTQLTLGVGMILLPDLARFGDLAGGGMQLLFLRYGRDAERQADDLGFRYTLQQGYDVRDMVNVFAQLQRAGEASGQSPLPSWLSTHPNPGERIERIQGQIAQLQQPLDQARRGVDTYMARIEGMIYGENPRHGFFTGTLFQHPDMRFRMQFPQGWRFQNLPQAVIAVSGQQDAMIQLTLAEGTLDVAANRFFGQQGLQSARVGRTTINGFPAVSGAFQARMQDGTVIAGVAAFISYENRVYQILGYSAAQQLQRYEPTYSGVIGSFNRLTDPQALNIQPNRIAVVRTTEPMTLAQFHARFPSRIPVEEVARINALAGPAAQIPTGSRVKRVIAGS